MRAPFSRTRFGSAFVFIALSASALSASALVPVAPVPPTAADAPPTPPSDATFTVTAGPTQPDDVKAGHGVELGIEVKNVSPRIATLTFSSGQDFDFVVTKKGDSAVVWKWSIGKMFSQMVRPVPVEPGKSLDFTAQWPGAAAGTYTVQGVVSANGGLKAPPFDIVVSP